MKLEFDIYLSLINDRLYEECFDLLEKQTSHIIDDIEQKRYLFSFFNELFEEINFLNFLNKEMLSGLGEIIYKKLNCVFFQDIRNRIHNVLKKEEASKMAAILLLDNKFDAAKFFLQYGEKDLSIYNSSINKIIKDNNIEALSFVCNNFTNIHFDSDRLLAKIGNMDIEAIEMLIKQFNFSINTQNILEENILISVISNNNIKNFDWLNKNYGMVLNYGKDKVFKLIENINPINFYEIMLNNKNLKYIYLEKIGNFLFSKKNIEVMTDTNMYESFFIHKNFDDQKFTLGQSCFIYGLISKIEFSVKTLSEDTTKNYINILNSYLNIITKEDIKNTFEFHIVGFVINIANNNNSKLLKDVCIAIIKRFNSYINKINPNGILPINQVEKNSELYIILINGGAVPSKEETNFWNNIKLLFKGKEKKQEYNNPKIINEKNNINNSSSIISIKIKMKNDFKEMQEYILNENCDSIIKIKCENMFLMSENLSLLMEKNNLSAFINELHFLSENFSNYLKQSLIAYINIADTSNLLNDSINMERLESAKKMCLKHVELLTEQLELITKNVSSVLNRDDLLKLKIRGKFLEERFNIVEKNEELIEENIVQVIKKQ